MGAPNEHVLAVAVAMLLTSAYFFAGHHYINRYFHAPFDVFMPKVFGSMLIRLLSLATAVFFILWLTLLPQITFTSALFISYISKSVLEIIFIHGKSVNNSKQG